MKINWMWDSRLSDTRVRKILKNENDPRFFIYAEKLFSRVNDATIAFEYVPKKVFYDHWPKIRQRIQKDAWAQGKLDYWQNIYKDASMEGLSTERVDIAQQIKNTRMELGFSQKEMAQKLGVIQQYVSKLEAGKENLSVDTLNRIANVFGKKLSIRFN